MEEIHDVLDHPSEIGWLTVESNSPREAEEVGQNGPKSLGFTDERINSSEHWFGLDIRGFEVPNRFLHQLGVQDHRGEGILDFMGEAAGEGSELGKSLGVGRPSFGDPGSSLSSSKRASTNQHLETEACQNAQKQESPIQHDAAGSVGRNDRQAPDSADSLTSGFGSVAESSLLRG